MPRQLFDIRGFNYGIISSLDEEDIPEESASSSLNIDGDAGEGILQGIPADNILLIDSNLEGDIDDAIGYISQGKLIEDNGIYDLIYHDSFNNTISAITDFYGTTASTKRKFNLVSSLTSDNVAMTVNSKEVHIGIDTMSPYWVGKVGHGQFNYGTSWTISNATNANPIVITVNSGVVSSVADYSGTVADTIKITTAAAHGLTTGQSVTISGTTNYNYTYPVFVIDTDEFYVIATYVSNQSGTFIQNHSLKNGNIVKVSGVTGNTAANGIWTVSAVNNLNGQFTLTNAIGNGAYVGGGTVELYLVCEEAECIPSYSSTSMAGKFNITVLTGSAADGYFALDTLYSWKYSLIYDGVQESPLAGIALATPAATTDFYSIFLTAWLTTPYGANTTGLSSLNKRITGINIYRADSVDGLQANLGFYRLVASIDINESAWYSYTSPFTDRKILIRDYGSYYEIDNAATSDTEYPSAIATYEENSGMPETITDTAPKYSLSRAGGGYHFIAKCYHSKIIDATRYIFKSKQLRYDMFDWSSDYLIMPEPITALEYYNGRLFAFSLNATYQINPELFFIEDVFSDAGCNNSRAVNTNEYGMFFCNANQAWMYNGGQFLLISDAIRQSASGGYSWRSFYLTTLTDFIVVSDSKKGYVLFINERDNTTDSLFAMAYNPLKKRWDAFDFEAYATSANAGAFQGKSGEVYLSNASNTYELMRHTSNRQAWEWYSQELTFSSTRQVKSIVMIKADNTGTVAITYGLDGGTVNVSGTNEALINAYAKSIRIKLSAAAGANSTDSLEILYRPLIGNR